MPKAGFKSVTFSQSVYDNFHILYEKRKKKLELQGIFSFAGFVTFKLNEILTNEKKRE